MSVMSWTADDAGPDRVERPPTDIDELGMYVEAVPFGSAPREAIELIGDVPWELREDAIEAPAPVPVSGPMAVLREARLRMFRPEEWEIRTGRERAYGAEMNFFELGAISSDVAVRIHEQRLGYWISSRTSDGDLVLALGRSRRIGGGTLPVLIAKLAARNFSRSASGVRVTVGRKTFNFGLDQESAAG
jgi:hypothetical protein